MPKTSVHNVNISKVTAERHSVINDLVAVEEPLEIRIGHGKATNRQQTKISVTMRTPDNDLELACGFLFTEGIVTSSDDITSVKHCEDVGSEEEKGNVVRVELQPAMKVILKSLQRNFYTTSSCGVCGKTSIDAIHVQQRFDINNLSFKVDKKLLMQLSKKVSAKQAVFTHTGGIHASALFSSEGELLAIREDVGRHNALDKLIGANLLKDELPLDNHVLWVSGRASFELVQKAAMAGISIMVAVGAPSSLAVELAASLGVTLVGFLKNDKFNIYSHPKRIQ